MKKKEFIVGLFFLLAFVMQGEAQEIRVNAGMHSTGLTGDGIGELLGDYTETKAGFHVSAEYLQSLPVTGFTLSGGVGYRDDRFVTGIDYPLELLNFEIPVGVSAETRLKQLAAPLLLNYEIHAGKVRFRVAAGPMVSYLMDADMIIRAEALLKFKIATFDLPTDGTAFNPWNVSGLARAGVDIPFGEGRLGLSGEYLHGFTSFTEVPIVELDNYLRNWGASVTYSHPLVYK